MVQAVTACLWGSRRVNAVPLVYFSNAKVIKARFLHRKVQKFHIFRCRKCKEEDEYSASAQQLARGTHVSPIAKSGDERFRE